MGSNAEIDKENIIPSTYEHLPEDVRLLLEERKKKRDEEDLLAALASIKVDRHGQSHQDQGDRLRFYLHRCIY